ncbi:major tail protein [Microbacterium phage Pikmin]|uniref:Major tail protein n=3 Tax=Pikminvirus pikmin TaxID=2560596 RepID=A0A2P1CKI1_9CAUD|nr:major tail protein [Microbacterium phage Pikmin]AVJ51004.1 major tail protein [Microbacterium phage Pajaza]AVJ51151.1 major tail protein [Microbacterium phage Pikmin]AVJ51709.1 major tail protein [Microbacterium phage Casey]
MAITQWAPSTQISRGNISVGVAPAIEDINSPQLSELSTGTGLDCAIQTFNGTSETDSEAVDWLCDPASEQIPGSTTHTIDDLVIKGTGQDDDDLIDSLSVGDTIYIWRRDGIEHSEALAASQKVWVWKVVVTSIDPLEANNTFIGITAHITVLARSATAVAIGSGE